MKAGIKLVSLAVISALAAPVISFAREREAETTVNMSSLPAAVQKTIKQHARGKEIVRVEQETEHGKMVYEGIVNEKGQEMGITVDANGKYIGTHSESKEHKEHSEAH